MDPSLLGEAGVASEMDPSVSSADPSANEMKGSADQRISVVYSVARAASPMDAAM